MAAILLFLFVSLFCFAVFVCSRTSLFDQVAAILCGAVSASDGSRRRGETAHKNTEDDEEKASLESKSRGKPAGGQFVS